MLLVYAIIYECVRPSLIDKIDKVTGYQTCFAEKGVRASVVYYKVRRGKMTAASTYLVFLPLAHERTLCSDADYAQNLMRLS